jgi:hypothetical protein
LLFSEHNDVGINGKPDDSSSSAIPADTANGLDEVAKRQCLVFVIGFHDPLVFGYEMAIV